jgi:hypothetical protein
MAEQKVEYKYRIVFLPAQDYEELKVVLDQKKLQSYLPFKEKGIENFSIGASKVVYIPDTHRPFLSMKAKSGESL